MSIESIPVSTAHELTADILRLLGTPAAPAETVARSLVGANQVGHDSHGVVRLPEYASFVRRGLVLPDAAPELLSSFGAVSIVDGHHGWGQVSARFAAEHAATAAKNHGIAAVGLRNCNHVGRIGEYAEQIAAHGLVSLIWCNADPTVAPFGGRDRVLGTNPLAIGIPVEGSHPFVLDFATAATAEGKLRVARAAGALVEPGAVIDAAGAPSVDPNDFYNGGALLAFGGHKGYGLSAFIELLGGALSGNHPSSTERYTAGNGVVIIAMNPEAFDALDFAIDIQDTLAALRSSTPQDPSRPVQVPGDVEMAVRAQRQSALPVASAIWEQVTALRAELGSSE